MLAVISSPPVIDLTVAVFRGKCSGNSKAKRNVYLQAQRYHLELHLRFGQQVPLNLLLQHMSQNVL